MSLPSVARDRPRLGAMRFPLFALLFALVAIPAAFWWHATTSSGMQAPDFTLVDTSGRPFTLSAQRGHGVVLFFGYTHCADACPTTLAHIAAALRKPALPRDERVAFVTVDGSRDTPARMKRYVDVFDPSFIGLTGTPAALDPVYAAYHVVRQTETGGAGGDYSVLHTTTIYYIGRDGTLKGFGDWDDTVPTIAEAVTRYQ